VPKQAWFRPIHQPLAPWREKITKPHQVLKILAFFPVLSSGSEPFARLTMAESGQGNGNTLRNGKACLAFKVSHRLFTHYTLLRWIALRARMSPLFSR
jgi:hypothetical protein